MAVGEQKKILSQMARRGNASTKVPAIKALREIEADEHRRCQDAAPRSPEAILDEIVKMLPAIRYQFADHWTRLIASLTPEEGAAFTRAATLPAGTSYHDYFETLSSGSRRANGADAAAIASADGSEANADGG